MKTQPPARDQTPSPATHSDTEVDMGPFSNRKKKKLIAEKKRRARINDCLNQIKSIVCGSACPSDPNISKMEKAEILESTLQFLQARQQPQTHEDPQVHYYSGYNTCAQAVMEYTSRQPGLRVEERRQLADHLNRHRRALNYPQTTPGVVPPGSYDNAALMNSLYHGQRSFSAGVPQTQFVHVSSYVQGPMISSSTPSPLMDLGPARPRRDAPITSQPTPSYSIQEMKKCVRARMAESPYRELKVVLPRDVNSPQREDSILHIAPADTSASSQEDEEHIENAQPASPPPQEVVSKVWRPW